MRLCTCGRLARPHHPRHARSPRLPTHPISTPGHPHRHTRHPPPDLQNSPVAGICVPVECEPEVLQSASLLAELTALSAYVRGNSTAIAHLAPSEQQQVDGYIAMLLDIVQTAKFLEVRRSTTTRSPAHALAARRVLARTPACPLLDDVESTA